MPSFVFSVRGQVGFRSALEHLLGCNKRDCIRLRKQVKDSSHKKLRWLFREEALLGCVHIQPFLYKTKTVADIRRNSTFKIMGAHLAHCPQESCAALRRALLLRIRDTVSPAVKAKSD